MTAGSVSKPIGTLSLAGSFVPSGEKKRALDEVFEGKNIRSTLDGGRIARPGYEDTEIDLSAFGFTASRGFYGGRFLKRLWCAGDDGSAVKILYTDPVTKSVFDTGLSLSSGYKVWFCEVEMDIYYGNGNRSNPMGRIIVGQVGTGGVTSGAGTLTLKGGHSVRFATSGSGRIGNDDFSWSGKSGDDLTGVTGISSDHEAGEVVTCATTLSPTYVTSPTVIAQWYASLNIAGDPNTPRVWEFSKTATAANPERFYDFSEAGNNELVGEGSEITGFIATNDYFYVFKEDSIHSVSRLGVGTDGSRPPLPFAPNYGIPNPWCVCSMEGVVAFLTTNDRVMPITIVTENASQSLSLDAQFDRRVRSYFRTIDKTPEALARRWVFFNPEDQLLKIGVTRGGVREILVYDAQLGIYYPPDTNKDFEFMAELNRKSYAYSEDGQRIYLDETGLFDDTVPVDSEWKTGRFGGEYTRSAFRYLYLHGRMSPGSKKTISIAINGEEKFEKTLDDSFIKTSSPAKPVGYAGIGVAGISSTGLSAQEFQMPIGSFEHGQDIQIRVSGGSEDGGDFVQIDGFQFGLTPRAKTPARHV